jgi:hypothetical protein
MSARCGEDRGTVDQSVEASLSDLRYQREFSGDQSTFGVFGISMWTLVQSLAYGASPKFFASLSMTWCSPPECEHVSLWRHVAQRVGIKTLRTSE